jgi:hypothetical protein
MSSPVISALRVQGSKYTNDASVRNHGAKVKNIINPHTGKADKKYTDRLVGKASAAPNGFA